MAIDFAQPGDAITARAWNDVAGAINALDTDRTVGLPPGGPAQTFLARVISTAELAQIGPPGATMYDDERYWIVAAAITNSGDANNRTHADFGNLNSSLGGFVVVATNLSEIQSPGHVVPPGVIVQVNRVLDGDGLPRFTFMFPPVFPIQITGVSGEGWPKQYTAKTYINGNVSEQSKPAINLAEVTYNPQVTSWANFYPGEIVDGWWDSGQGGRYAFRSLRFFNVGSCP